MGKDGLSEGAGPGDPIRERERELLEQHKIPYDNEEDSKCKACPSLVQEEYA